MTERIIIAGSGGQGIMVLGKVLAEAAMRENKQVTWLPSYGAEVRGGTSHCMVIISDREIGSPYIEKADTLIIMNEPSFERFKNKLTHKGLLIVNSSLVSGLIDAGGPVAKARPKNLHLLQHPFTDIAIKLGNIKIANMVALGCYLGNKKIVSIKSILGAIETIAPEEKKHLVQINKKALVQGVSLK